MMHLTVLIPSHEAADEVERLVPQFARLLDSGQHRYEILCVDGGSSDHTLYSLEKLCQRVPAMRLLHLNRPAGLSAALTAGIAAARGEVILAFEASGQYLPAQMHWLIERLARADLVMGRRQQTRYRKLCQSVLQWPRRWLLGLETRDPDCLFWAARREAVAELNLAPGMHRFLGSLVTTRGYRVSEIHVDHQPARSSRWNEPHPNLGNLLAVWWQRRHWRPYFAEELGQDEAQRSAA